MLAVSVSAGFVSHNSGGSAPDRTTSRSLTLHQVVWTRGVLGFDGSSGRTSVTQFQLGVVCVGERDDESGSYRLRG